MIYYGLAAQLNYLYIEIPTFNIVSLLLIGVIGKTENWSI